MPLWDFLKVNSFFIEVFARASIEALAKIAGDWKFKTFSVLQVEPIPSRRKEIIWLGNIFKS